MGQLWSELKRRNVIRAAGIYIVVAWVILQVLDTVGDFLNMPLWMGRATIILMLLLFPIALYLAWAYEISDGRIHRQHKTDQAKPVGPRDYILITALLILVGTGSYQVFLQQDHLFEEPGPAVELSAPLNRPVPGKAVDVAENSIAVLPFVNMSSDPEQEYFSDGITEEILNVLARVPGLQVTSRTSSFSFKNSKTSIHEIARSLGVAYILEGSVRKSNDRVRITAQLIKVEPDIHLYSDTWDRNLDNIFAVQDEISEIIGEIITNKLVTTPPPDSTETTVSKLPANVLEEYLQATQLMAVTNYSNAEEAEKLLRGIIEVAPNFSQAHSRLANVYLSMLQIGQKILPAEALGKARTLADRALELNPSNAEAMNILSYIYRDEGNVEASKRMLAQALSLEPGNAATLRQIISNSAYERELVIVDELAQRLLGVDPRSENTLLVLQDYYRRADKMELAVEMMQRMESLEDAVLMYLTVMDVNGYHNGGPEMTAVYTKQAYDKEPRFAESAARLVNSLLDIGDVEAAANILQTSPGFEISRFSQRWAQMLYSLYVDDRATAYALAFELSDEDEQDRYGSKAMALRISLLQTMQLKEGFRALVERYIAAFPELTELVVPNSGSVPPILVKYAHFMAANDLALLYKLLGDTEKSDAMDSAINLALQQWPRLSVLGYGIADVELLARNGDKAGALAALEDAINEDWHHLWWFHLDFNPHLDSLRNEPKFVNLRQRFGAYERK